LAALFPNAQDATVGDVVPEPVVFVEDLADRLATEFPDLWKLGQVKIMTIVYNRHGQPSKVFFAAPVRNFKEVLSSFCT
jgi:hypothetical protein